MRTVRRPGRLCIMTCRCSRTCLARDCTRRISACSTPHYLQFTTAKYNFAAREFYEEYLYDDRGQVMFIYARTPDVDSGFVVLYELRMWFDNGHLLRFTAKREEGKAFKEIYSGTTIPEMYQSETDRCRQRAQRFLTMFKGIDDNTYL